MATERSRQWQAWFDEICQENKVSPAETGKFQPEAGDAFKLAAIQWWAANIARLAIELYATDRRQYDRMSRVFRDAAAALEALAGQKRAIRQDTIGCSSDPECPPGWYCDEGTCVPEDGLMPPTSPS